MQLLNSLETLMYTSEGKFCQVSSEGKCCHPGKTLVRVPRRFELVPI